VEEDILVWSSALTDVSRRGIADCALFERLPTADAHPDGPVFPHFFQELVHREIFRVFELTFNGLRYRSFCLYLFGCALKLGSTI
jgi:hypothetical protein